jgi:vancomycin permeability regulator SanA
MRCQGLFHQLGRDGLFTLALSILVIAATAGLSLLLAGMAVFRRAWGSPAVIPACDLLLVPGHRLEENRPVRVFTQRLDRACQLFAQGLVGRILVLGGRTGANSLSEAELGRSYLLGCGVPASALEAECSSRHTLENLRMARDHMGSSNPRLGLVSSRYHLARCLALAAGLGLHPAPCAAEERPALRLHDWLREAFFLHWYHTGRLWSELTRNEASLKRIR